MEPKQKKRATRRFPFTKIKLAGLNPPKSKRQTVYDTHQTGLACAVYPSGRRTFYWFRVVASRPVWKTLGVFPAMSIEQARKAAADANRQLEKWKGEEFVGRDPFEKQERFTLGAGIDFYIDGHLRPTAKNADRAVKGMEWLRDHHLKKWKNWPLVAIRRKHVIERQVEVRRDSGQYAATRMVQMLKAVFNYLVRMEKFEGVNPCLGVELDKGDARKRYLRADELPKLFEALQVERNLDLRDFTLLALATGARRGDILSARWENVHLGRGIWEIPDPKNEKPYAVNLSKQALSVFMDRRRRIKGEFVFPSISKAGHILDCKRSWKQLLKRAGISDLRVHDLRRTLGSWQASAGVSLPIIGKSLGHSSIQATEIYAQVDDRAVRESVANANDELFTAGKVPLERLLEAPRE